MTFCSNFNCKPPFVTVRKGGSNLPFAFFRSRKTSIGPRTSSVQPAGACRNASTEAAAWRFSFCRSKPTTETRLLASPFQKCACTKGEKLSASVLYSTGYYTVRPGVLIHVGDITNEFRTTGVSQCACTLSRDGHVWPVTRVMKWQGTIVPSGLQGPAAGSALNHWRVLFRESKWHGTGADVKDSIFWNRMEDKSRARPW